VAQKIKQANIFGRIGSGVGQGLAEQIPKEIDRSRLASGLEKFERESTNLTPMQGFVKALAIPGVAERPQIVQSLGDLQRQQSYLNSLKNQYQDQGKEQPKTKGYVPTEEEVNQPMKGQVNTLATPEATAESYKTAIPPTEQEERKDAYQSFQKNPARYDYDFNNALNERKATTTRNSEIQQAYKNQEATAVDKETQAKAALKTEIDKLGLNNIPPKAKQKFEEKILNAILSEKEGGEGLTQENAIKKYSKEMDQANRNYLDLSSLSAWSPVDFNRRANALQKEFASRGEQQMMMDKMIADQQVSPLYAAHKAYPLQKEKIPTLNKLGVQVGSPTIAGVSIPKMNDITYEKLKKEMGKENSPLSIAYELQQKSQNPRGWLKYLDDHRDDLEVWQADQLTKNLNVFDIKDMWLRAWE
jgi:hypothetical protein